VDIGDAIGCSEHIPRLPHRQHGGPGEEPETADRVVWSLELEEEELAWLYRPESGLTRPPEVDLAQLRPRLQEPVPAVVSGRDEPSHSVSMVRPSEREAS